jgi:formate dehydrogenase major subunit
VLHKDSFPIGKRAALRMIAFVPTAETTDAEFPMLLSTGRTLQHFNAGTMTYRTPQVRLQESDYLDISPQDGARLGIGERDQVRVVSRYGTVVLPARLNVNVNPGMLFATVRQPADLGAPRPSDQGAGIQGDGSAPRKGRVDGAPPHGRT